MKTMSLGTSIPSVSGSFYWFISTEDCVPCTSTCNGRQTDRHHTTGGEGMIALLQMNLTDFRQIAGSIRIDRWQDPRLICLYAIGEWIILKFCIGQYKIVAILVALRDDPHAFRCAT